MFSIRYLLPIGSAAFLCASAFADTIILKSGEKLEGKVVGETPTELTVEVKISAGITDLTKIAKNTVAKIEKEQLDEVAWQPLKNIKLGANSLPSAQYDAVMRPLQNFVGDFPTSSHKAEAETIIASFAEEQKRVDAGEVRMGQNWLSKAEVEQERYQINATLAYQYIRGQVTAGHLVCALNSFEQIETTFNGARVYPDRRYGEKHPGRAEDRGRSRAANLQIAAGGVRDWRHQRGRAAEVRVDRRTAARSSPGRSGGRGGGSRRLEMATADVAQ